jgi:hypothetical protein
MNIKENINKIHIGLILTFESVKLEEKSSHEIGNYFELVATKDNTDVKMIISKRDLENETFKWSYYANPLNEKSDLVERVSNATDLCGHVVDIISNNRFNKEYLDTIKKTN